MRIAILQNYPLIRITDYIFILFDDCLRIRTLRGGGGGGVQGKFFWSSRFELWAPQVPLIIRKTFGEILGPRGPTVSEPRPAQKLGVKY